MRALLVRFAMNLLYSFVSQQIHHNAVVDSYFSPVAQQAGLRCTPPGTQPATPPTRLSMLSRHGQIAVEESIHAMLLHYPPAVHAPCGPLSENLTSSTNRKHMTYCMDRATATVQWRRHRHARHGNCLPLEKFLSAITFLEHKMLPL